jgi:hypothetical protein
MSDAPEVQGANIVLRGDFNPKIFQPAWFSAQQLIPARESEEAEIEIITTEVTSFRIPWLQVQVTSASFRAETEQESHLETLRDLVVGTFKILSHTPIQFLGINAFAHLRMRSEDQWHAFGNRLAPKGPWSVLNQPGLLRLDMLGQRKDPPGLIRTQVEPSSRIQPGVFVFVNDHYAVGDPGTAIGCEEVVTLLQDNWDRSRTRFLTIVDSLLHGGQDAEG